MTNERSAGRSLKRTSRQGRSHAIGETVSITLSSGNVFADLGFAEPELELAKADLLLRVQRIIRRRHLSAAAIAIRLKISRANVSAVLRGRLTKLSIDRLIRMLTALGQEVQILITEPSPRRKGGSIRVR